MSWTSTNDTSATSGNYWPNFESKRVKTPMFKVNQPPKEAEVVQETELPIFDPKELDI